MSEKTTSNTYEVAYFDFGIQYSSWLLIILLLLLLSTKTFRKNFRIDIPYERKYIIMLVSFMYNLWKISTVSSQKRNKKYAIVKR